MRRDRRPILASAFALVAFTVSALILDFYWRVFDEVEYLGPIVALIFALIPAQAGAVSGYVLARTDTRTRGFSLLILLNVAFGAIAGLLLGIAVGSARSVIDWSAVVDGLRGCVTGSMVLASVPLPALAAVYALERRVGRARPLSLLDDWDRRRIWFGAFACIAPIAWLSAVLLPRPNPLATASLSLAGIGLTVFWLTECAIRWRVKRTVFGAERLDAVPDSSETAELDLGIGSEHWYRAKTPAMPYRSALRPALLIRGTLSQALLRIDRGILIDSLALLAVVVAAVQVALA